SATVPDTCGAAMLVPESSTYTAVRVGAGAWPSGKALAGAFPAAAGGIRSPGATRSGLGRPSPVGPLEEKYDTPYVCGMSRCVEPTVIASSALPASLILR